MRSESIWVAVACAAAFGCHKMTESHFNDVPDSGSDGFDDVPDSGSDGGEPDGGGEVDTGAPDVVCWAATARAGDETDNSGDWEVLGVDGYADGAAVVAGRFHTYGEAVFGEGEPGETVVSTGGAFVARYHPDGTLDWARGLVSDVQNVAAAPDGTAVISGDFNLTEIGSSTYNLAAIGDGAVAIWAQTATQAPAIAVSADGSVIAAGGDSGPIVLDEGGPNETTVGTTSGYTVWIAEFADDGALVWACEATDAGLTNRIWSAAVHDDGHFAVSGNTSNDMVLAAFGPDGEHLWSRHADTSADYEVESRVLAAADGSYVVGGIHWQSLSFWDGTEIPIELQAPVEGDPISIEAGAYFLARYDADGELQWATSSDNADVYDHAAAWSQSVALLPEDGILVAGFLVGEVTFGWGEPEETTLMGHPLEGPATHAFVARYGIDGLLDWAIELAPGAMMFEVGAAGASTDGSMFLSGIFEGSAEFELDEGGTTTVEALGNDDLFLIDLCP